MSPAIHDRVTPEQFPLGERRELADTNGLTIDGSPAIVIGVRLDYPSVLNLETAAATEFAWPTIARVIEQSEGAFSS